MNFAKEIMQLPILIKESSKEMKKVKSICGCAMLTTLNVVAGTFFIPLSSIFAGVSGMIYGPVLTGFAGIIADTLKYIARPDGPYFPGFALNEFLIGMIYGCFFYKKELSFLRVLAARLCITVFINLFLTSLWLNILYQSQLFTLLRIFKNVIMFPIDVALLYFALKATKRIPT